MLFESGKFTHFLVFQFQGEGQFTNNFKTFEKIIIQIESETRCFKIILSCAIIGIIHNSAEDSFEMKKTQKAQCGNVRIFMPPRFYMKSISGILEVQKQQLLQFWRL